MSLLVNYIKRSNSMTKQRIVINTGQVFGCGRVLEEIRMPLTEAGKRHGCKTGARGLRMICAPELGGCGREYLVALVNAIGGRQISCGCVRKQRAIENIRLAHLEREWHQNIYCVGGVGFIALEHPDGRSIKHMFDAELYELISSVNWTPSGNYLSGWYGSERILLHWIVLGLNSGRGYKENVDHINHDTTDSRRCNLRVVLKRHNDRNKSVDNGLPYCVQRSGLGYKVSVSFSKKLNVFSPYFSALDSAIECRDKFYVIAEAVDRGERDLPTKQELREIADSLR